MNRISVVAAAALAAASLSAIAAGTTTTSTLTREEVRAELRDLKATGLYQDVREASPTPLDDQHRDQKFSQIYGRDRVAQAVAERDGLMALVDREDEAPVIFVEPAPQDEAQPVDNSGALPFDHPAVRDGSPSDEAPQVPAQ